MKSRNSSRNLNTQTLLQAASYPARTRTIFGVILDATGHYKTDESIDYVTRLKIIDHSLNTSKKPYQSQMENFMYVFIFTETVEDAPQIGRIGDIIRLQNFEFDSYQRVVKAVFHKKRSSWTLFDGRKNANMTSIISSDSKSIRLKESEQNTLHKLRMWSESFFSSKTLHSMAWFKRAFPKKVVTNKVYELKDVDIVVLLLNEVSVRVNEQFFHKLVFVDKLKNIYLAELKGLLSSVDKGDVMKLRSITLVLHNGQYKINFQSYSNFMILQKSFRDSKDLIEATRKITYDITKLKNQFFEELHLNKRVKKAAGPNSYEYSTNMQDDTPLNLELVKKNYENSFPILKNFHFESSDLDFLNKSETEDKSHEKGRGRSNSKTKNKVGPIDAEKSLRGSAILSKHYDIPLSNLKEIAKKLKSKSKSKGGDLFRIKVSIKTIENSDFNSNFKIFSKKKNKTWELTTKKRRFDGDEKVIFFNIFGMKDDSLKDSDSPVPVYLITYNMNPNYIFDLWRVLPDHLSVGDWLAVQNDKKKRFEGDLSSLKDHRKEYEMVLQLVKAEKGKVYLKLIDTIFWFVQN